MKVNTDMSTQGASGNFYLLQRIKHRVLFTVIAFALLFAMSLASANQQIACFDYANLSTSEQFVSGFAAAACYGYYGATQEQGNPGVFSQLKTFSEAADVMEGQLCESRDISVGIDDASLPNKFEQGRGLARNNASMVQSGAMELEEFQTRVGACAKVVTHYTQVLNAVSSQ